MQRKLIFFATLIVMTCCFISFTSIVNAGVTEGRQLLFNNGMPTYSGIISANDEFKTVLATDPDNQEANLFYAITRIVAFSLDNGNNASLETIRDLYETFGLVRTEQDSLDYFPMELPESLNDQYTPPSTFPSGEEFHDFLAGPFIEEFTGAIDNLDTIAPTFSTVLTAVELNGAPVSLDYYDVLIVKAMLLNFKTIFEFIVAYDIDSVDIRELLVLGSAGVLQVQRDLLDKYDNALSLRTEDGANHLAVTWETLNNAINSFAEAFAFVKSQYEVSDYRDTHVFSFDSQDALDGAGEMLAYLQEVQNSIAENRVADYSEIEDWFSLSSTEGGYDIDMSIYYNGQGEITNKVVYSGNFFEDYPVIDLFSLINNEVSFTISHIGSSCTVAFNGSVDSSNDITGTMVTSPECLTQLDHTFTGYHSQYLGEDLFNVINLNQIFGTNSQTPLNLAAVLPNFSDDNNPLYGTFPPTDETSPVLNGIFPKATTSQDLSWKFDLSKPTSLRNPLIATKLIDGNFQDWLPDTPILTDQLGDNASYCGEDLAHVFMAMDEQYMYFAITFQDLISAQPSDKMAEIHLRYPWEEWYSYRVSAGTDDNGMTWWVKFRDPNYRIINEYQFDHAAAGEKFIEMRIPLSDVTQAMGSIDGIHIEANGQCDQLEASTRINTTTISGNVIIPASAFIDGHKIFVGAYYFPPTPYNEIGSTYIDETSQSFSISGIPFNAGEVFIVARLDDDGNGAVTPADLSWYSTRTVSDSPVIIDIDFEEIVTQKRLADSILNLRILIGENPFGLEMIRDHSNDGKYGIDDAIYSLQDAAELIQP
ncbi:hypothetical protein [Desulfosediminicola flagellatus]|uniref:hypothetical protein n=1 Tax=Desulfosediminicola flagellatus TaxID=2569541 RepID=UPI0010AD49B3|nr:hypothetical protein [Desulfosediminicola flagellatus]